MKTDSLYQLVQALDKGELRYCRNVLLKDNNTVAKGRLLLFDALVSMPKHNEQELKALVAHHPITTNLSVEKGRLYNLLLHTIFTLQNTRLAANEPSKKLQEAKTMLSLGLLEDAAESIIKGLTSAVALEELFLEVPLRELLREVYKNLGHKNLSKKRTENEYLLETASRKLATLIRYTQINDRAFDYIRQYRVSNAQGVKRGFKELINLPEMQNINKADSLPSQLRYYNIWNLYHNGRNEPNQAIKALKSELQLWESNQARIMLYPHMYLSSISNLLGKLNITGRLEEAPIYLEKMSKVNVQSRRSEIFKFSNVELQYQLYYMNSGKLEEALQREQIIVTGLRKYGKGTDDSKRITLLYNLGATHLICDNEGSALAYFNRIKNMGQLADRQDLQGIARLLRLLLLSENDSDDTFSHFLRNSHRFFQSGQRTYALEDVVCHWIKKHHLLTEVKERKASFGVLAKQLAPFVKERTVGAEEMELWAQAKTKGVSIKKIYKEKLV